MPSQSRATPTIQKQTTPKQQRESAKATLSDEEIMAKAIALSKAEEEQRKKQQVKTFSVLEKVEILLFSFHPGFKQPTKANTSFSVKSSNNRNHFQWWRERWLQCLESRNRCCRLLLLCLFCQFQFYFFYCCRFQRQCLWPCFSAPDWGKGKGTKPGPQKGTESWSFAVSPQKTSMSHTFQKYNLQGWESWGERTRSKSLPRTHGSCQRPPS